MHRNRDNSNRPVGDLVALLTALDQGSVGEVSFPGWRATDKLSVEKLYLSLLGLWGHDARTFGDGELLSHS